MNESNPIEVKQIVDGARFRVTLVSSQEIDVFLNATQLVQLVMKLQGCYLEWIDKTTPELIKMKLDEVARQELTKLKEQTNGR
jgi:hypothetical protein